MSGDLWVMARNGTTLLPSEVKKLAADYDRLRAIVHALREPSWDLGEAVWESCKGYPLTNDELRKILRAAVATAEQEAA